ncbi:MAG: polysaccharide biosynthesis/export family protein [Lewinellaceae bacterium]|nr:polysaccharide biosynthesis/export family protein [Lewinellaceae bacterium]
MQTTIRYLMVFLVLSSCVRQKDLVTFRDANFNLAQAEAIANQMELKIQPEDLLQVDVATGQGEIDQLATAPFNLPIGQNQLMQMQGGSQGSTPLELFMGYFVDSEGFVDLPTLGRVEVGGLTLREAKQKLIGLLTPYLNVPVVNIRFLNFKVTVLGEVTAPGAIRLSNQRVTILEALGYAGDFTPYANRSSVLLIREQDGQRTYTQLNLQQKDIFTSPYFYLQQNDVIYVQPTQAKVATVADPLQRAISYGSGVISIVTLIIALTR